MRISSAFAAQSHLGVINMGRTSLHAYEDNEESTFWLLLLFLIGSPVGFIVAGDMHNCNVHVYITISTLQVQWNTGQNYNIAEKQFYNCQNIFYTKHDSHFVDFSWVSVNSDFLCSWTCSSLLVLLKNLFHQNLLYWLYAVVNVPLLKSNNTL